MLTGEKSITVSINMQERRVGTIKPLESKNQGLYLIPYHLFSFVELIHNPKATNKTIFIKMLFKILKDGFISKNLTSRK